MKDLKLPRVFHELNPEVDKTIQLWAMGYDYKDVAELKIKSTATINSQIYNAKKALNESLSVVNASTLAIEYCKRMTSLGLPIEVRPFPIVI